MFEEMVGNNGEVLKSPNPEERPTVRSNPSMPGSSNFREYLDV